MSPDCDKKIFIILDGFIYCAEIATDVYAAISMIPPIERVIAKSGVEGILGEYSKPFFKLIFLGDS